MVLTIQVYSLLFSFFYGMFFYFLLEINYKFLYNDKFIFKFIYTLVFILFNTLLYFVCLKRINNGVVHIYFLLVILLGYIIAKFLLKKIIRLHKRK